MRFALRAALGASRGRLLQQQLVQALVVAVIGTALGLIVALWFTPALFIFESGIDGCSPSGQCASSMMQRASICPFFLLGAGVMVFSGLGFGLLPAIRAARTDLRGFIGNVSRERHARTAGTRRLLGSFVIVELAIAAVLLTASITATQHASKRLINKLAQLDSGPGSVELQCTGSSFCFARRETESPQLGPGVTPRAARSDLRHLDLAFTGCNAPRDPDQL